MPLFGIDVSHYNGDLNFKLLKNAGVRFAIAKTSQGHGLSSSYYLFDDSKWKRNAEGFFSEGIPFGAYHFFTGESKEGAIKEAEYFMSKVEPYRTKLSLYLACDAENYGNKWLLGLSRDKLTENINAFCDRVEKEGYKPCVYTNTDHIRNFIKLSDIKYQIWHACYGREVSKPLDAGKKLAIHQYTGSGTLPGIRGQFDLNFGYAPLAWLILVDRCGLEEQTRRYIEDFCTGDEILMKLADNVVKRTLNRVKKETTEKLSSIIGWYCGLTSEETAYLLKYRFASELYRKLYEAMLVK